MQSHSDDSTSELDLRGHLLSAQPWPVLDVVLWLAREGRFSPGIAELVAALGERLIAAGAPVCRLFMGARTLHPQVLARTVEWRAGGDLNVNDVPHSLADVPEFVGSPIDVATTTGKPYRRRLVQLDAERDHALLIEVAERGYTDYLAIPLLKADGSASAVLIINTRVPEGFSAGDVDGFCALADFLAPVVEALGGVHVARTLLDTYLGRRTGERVLRGQIQRGEGEHIRAALWFSDLRESTRLSETLPLPDMLAALNQYFELVSAAVIPHGGEILRFIGDAMLIVFNDDGQNAGARTGNAETGGVETDGIRACRSALEAIEDAYNALDVLNHRRKTQSLPTLSFGVGLHYGEVIYGNVGAPDRLDFTVMGAAVNETARLEGLTKSLHEPVLMSREFVTRASAPVHSCGEHQMKGFAAPREVFGLGSSDTKAEGRT